MLARSFSDVIRGRGLGDLVKPENLETRKLTPQHSAAAATLQTFEFSIPRDKFIHSILISIGESTTANGETEQGTLADDITDIELDSSMGQLKKMTGGMAKQIAIINKEVPSTGYYKLYFTDPVIKQALPIPSWLLSTLTLKITDNAPAASNYHHIRVSVVESSIPAGIALTGFRTLVERYVKWSKFAANTGDQEYEHERTATVYGYLYTMDDNATLSDTIFDRLTLRAVPKGGPERKLADAQWVTHLKEQNKIAYQNALGTGYVYAEFPEGFDSQQFTTLKSLLNIPSAGTNAGLRVLERQLV